MYTILVIDDDEPLRIIVRHLLDDEFNILMAQNAQEAIDLLSQNSVNLILCDIYMPGMSGIQLLESLQGDTDKKDIPVLIMTSLPSEDKKDLATDLGASDFIDKILLYQDKEKFLNRVRMKVLTDVRIPNLDDTLVEKKKGMVSKLMNDAVFGTFESITNTLCKQLHDLFGANYSSFWILNNDQTSLAAYYKNSELPDPNYSADNLKDSIQFQKIIKNKNTYWSNHIYKDRSGIMNSYSVKNKLAAEIGIPLFSINEKMLLLNNMQIPKDKPIFGFLNIKRTKLFSTTEYELLKKIVEQMNPVFWRLFQSQ